MNPTDGNMYMHQASRPLLLLAIFAGTLVAATPAGAVPTTFVAAGGNDAGNCTIAAPCATFAFALTRTNANGIINVLSSGSYGPLVINKSVSINAVGVEARIEGTVTCSFDPASICVNAAASSVVTIRGLRIDPRNPANGRGIVVARAAALHVRNTTFHGSEEEALRFAPTVASALFVSDSIFIDNHSGPVVISSGTDARAVFNRVQIKGSDAQGIGLTSGTASIDAIIRDSFVAKSLIGILATNPGGGGGKIRLMIDRATIINSFTGITASSDATVRIGNSTVSGNSEGLHGAVLSYGTNKISANVNDGDAPGSVAPR